MAADGHSPVAVVGAGAVGCFYGAMLARAGQSVTLIGREPHVGAIRTRGLQLLMGGQRHEVAVDAQTSIDAVAGAGVVLVCVKSTATAQVAAELAPRLAPDALVMSLQNGVDNADTLASQLRRTVVPVAVYVATEMAGPGVVQHHGRGDLVIGPLDAAAAADAALAGRLREVAARFEAAQVPVRISADVVGELWRKLLVNCAYNAISAVTQQPYGRMAAVPVIVELQQLVVREVVAVASAAGRPMGLDASLAAVAQIAVAMPGQRSSTAQDLARGKPTEIDHLNGTIVRLGAQHGVPTPANQALLALVKLAEAK